MNNLTKIICIFLTIALIASNAFWIMNTPDSEQQEKISVRFAYQFGFHYGQQIIMDHFDLVEKWSNGVAIATYQTINGGTSQLEAFIGESLEFGSMGAAPAVKGISQGVDIKIFATMGQKQAAIWTWREDIDSLADIKLGDTVNVAAVNSVYHMSLIKAFTDIGRTVNDVNDVVVFYSHPDAYQLMEQREIDAVFASAPYNSMYEKAGYKYIGDEPSIWGTPMAGSVIVGRVSFCEENPEIASAVYMAWLEATNWINTNPEEASYIIGEVYGYNMNEVWQDFQEANLVFNPTFGLSALKNFANIMYDLDVIDKQLSEQDMIFEHSLGVIGR